MNITFLGGAGSVTGSKYLIETQGKSVLVDCGLFQGGRKLRERNWNPLPINSSQIDAVLLTHAHMDHSGYIPVLCKEGYKGPIITTSATKDLCTILLADSGHIQEREAEYANRKGYSRHRPAKPLYNQKDAESCMKHFNPVEFLEPASITSRISALFRPAGHILGAATIELTIGTTKIVFSGDLGRYDDPVMVDPLPIEECDYLLMESTYGNRVHEPGDPATILAELIKRVTSRGGTVVIPSFAVGRAQSLLFQIWKLKVAQTIPNLPVFLDSPMAINASNIFCAHMDEHRLTADECNAACEVAKYTRRTDESKQLSFNRVPKIILSASGMATGGRILHHIRHYGPDKKNAILFAGYQAAGTRGAAMTRGAKHIKIFGKQVPIRAEVSALHMLSAHADSNETMTWLGNFKMPPRKTFIIHGEQESSTALERRIINELGWDCTIPKYRQSVDLT